MYVKQAKENYIQPKAETQGAVPCTNVLTSLSMQAGVDNFGLPGSGVDDFGTGGSSVGDFGTGGSDVGNFGVGSSSVGNFGRGE